MLKLSREDWIEIAEALWTKLNQIRNGDFGESDDTCDIEQWADDIEKVIDVIGEEAEYAIALGVEPVLSETPNSLKQKEKV